MILFRCKIKNCNALGLFVSFLYLFCCCWFFASVFIFNNKDKIGYIVIINIVINIKKINGGNNAMLLGDFALEPSENLNLNLLRTDFADFKRVQLCHFSSDSNKSYIILKVE